MGLFMLRKDSERRATLHRVLTDYISLVVGNIQESVPQVSKLAAAATCPQMAETTAAFPFHGSAKVVFL